MKKQRPANIGLAIGRLKCFYETFVQSSTAVILLDFCAKNPSHRQAENCYMPFQDDPIINGQFQHSYKICKEENLLKTQ